MQKAQVGVNTKLWLIPTPRYNKYLNDLKRKRKKILPLLIEHRIAAHIEGLKTITKPLITPIFGFRRNQYLNWNKGTAK